MRRWCCGDQNDSKVQKTVSLSTAEEEYYAASEMGIEVLYLNNLLWNMGFPQEHGKVAHQCTRAPNGVTALLAEGSVRSTSTRASTLHMKSSRIARCA